MKWIDGSNIDIKNYSGEDLCERIANDMNYINQQYWSDCPDFIQAAMYIIDFDTVLNMEGFPVPYYGYFTSEYYAKIVESFRLIGDDKDFDILSKAGNIEAKYSKLLSEAKGSKNWDTLYDEFSKELDELESELYSNRDFDLWSLLYEYLDVQIRLI